MEVSIYSVVGYTILRIMTGALRLVSLECGSRGMGTGAGDLGSDPAAKKNGST